MSTAPFSVVAVSNDALRPELLDRLLVDVNDCTVIVVESVARAYTKIRQEQPHVVVLLTNIDDVDACQLLSMLHMDRSLRGISVVTCATGPDVAEIHRSCGFEKRYDARVPLAS